MDDGACSSCPTLREAGLLFPSAEAQRSCVDCPKGYVRARFAALRARGGEGRTAVRSCRRVVEA